MARIKPQASLEERLVEDEELEEACDALAQMREEIKAARDTMVKAQLEAFNDRQVEIRGKFDAVKHEAVLASRQQGFIRDYAAGTVVRSGRWTHQVEEYQTMEKVERGTALRVRRPVLAPRE